MTFLVSAETPGRGSYAVCVIENDSNSKRAAQSYLVELLVKSGLERSKIGVNVTDNFSLEIGIHRIHIVPINKLDTEKCEEALECIRIISALLR